MVTLRELREQANMSQKELARLCNVTQATIARIESGEQNITIKTARMFAKVFNIRPYVLLPEDFQPEPLTAEEEQFLKLLRKFKAEAVQSAGRVIKSSND